MADILTPAARSARMRAVRRTGTKPEQLTKDALLALRVRFQEQDKGLPGTPDFTIPRLRVAIQVRGCFWHSHVCRACAVPRTRRNFWIPKLSENVRRDRRQDRQLRALGYSVVTIWECQCRSAESLAGRIQRALARLKARRATRPSPQSRQSDSGE